MMKIKKKPLQARRLLQVRKLLHQAKKLALHQVRRAAHHQAKKQALHQVRRAVHHQVKKLHLLKKKKQMQLIY